MEAEGNIDPSIKVAINAILLDGVLRHQRPDMMLYKEGGEWKTRSTNEYLCSAAAVAQWLKGIGIKAGDRVATFSNNRPEWHMADLGILGMNAVHVPVYLAESSERLQFILSDSGARVCFVSKKEQLEILRKVWPELPDLELAVMFDSDVEGEGLVGWREVADAATGQKALQQFVRRARAVDPDSIATLIYTSGTTGRPKGVLLTQSNLGTNARDSMGDFKVFDDDLAMSLLPLCHIYERTVGYSHLRLGLTMAYAESFDTVVANMAEVRPTIMAVVPRFFEKFHARLMAALEQAPPLRKRIFNWAVAVGRQNLPYKLAGKNPPLLLGLKLAIAGKLVYRGIHERLGGRIRGFHSGGAPLSKPLNEFFNAIGFNIYEGYGLTETSPVITTNIMGPPYKPGTVGPLIPNVEVKIAGDGEILSRGPHIMKGYYGLEKETAEALEGGWFHTGDIGHLDEDGYLVITDRKKDIIKTAAGKMIAPQPIENQLKQSNYIQNAIVIGDRRKFVSVLLVPNYDAVEEYARQRNGSFNDRKELLALPLVRELMERELAASNESLAQFEKPKKFTLLLQEFSFDAGQLTYTQKVRRRNIEEHYAEAIDAM